MPIAFVLATATIALPAASQAAPVISRLTPPSRVTSGFGSTGAVIARFLPDQRFDLQATVIPDETSKSVVAVEFFVDNVSVGVISSTVPNPANGSLVDANRTTGTPAVRVLPLNARVASLRAYRNTVPGVHTLRAVTLQSDGLTSERSGVFEIVNVSTPLGRRARNVVIFIGDGMGIAHRTAARIMLQGVSQGKSNGSLAMDTFPGTALVTTSSLNSIVTDSSPGAGCYSTGNKGNNNEHGVFPDDTSAIFDNPRIETMGEFMFRKYGKTLGIVTTSDVFDATPGSFGSHTQARAAGTGIVDQYLNEQIDFGGLRVLLGGGRRWFLPSGATFASGNGYDLLGSSRSNGNDYVLPPDVVAGWGVPAGTLDQGTNVIAAFQGKGFTYASDATTLASANTTQLLGLFHTGNMNIALDKLAKRRNAVIGNLGGKNPTTNAFVVDEYGFPNQPMLEEMTSKALETLNKNPAGFTLMVEAASIDKQAHNMDSERWIMDTIEFDKSIKVAQDFANRNPDTLVVVTADHECAGVNIIGASLVNNNTLNAANQASLLTRAQETDAGSKTTRLRNEVVGLYEAAGFPQYSIATDGYPADTDPNRKMLIGYAANADRNEDWLTNPMPLQDGQSILTNGVAAGAGATFDYDDAPLSAYPLNPTFRDNGFATSANQLGFIITGQVGPSGGGSAAHTASDIPLSAYGRGASLFFGVMDNTDVYFRIMQAMIGGAK
ncbi:MAG: alkaline phosphatase [Fibrella sp.]|nr:alkaline phosphatase [Armatimonadota bacterium]